MKKFFAVLALLSSTAIHASDFIPDNDVTAPRWVHSFKIQSDTDTGMSADEYLCYRGQKEHMGKVDPALSILSPIEGRFTALGFHVALDLSKINTSNKIAKANKNCINSFIEWSKEPSKLSEFRCEERKEYLSNVLTLYRIANNEIKVLKRFHEPVVDDSVVDGDNKKSHVDLLIKHANLLFNHSHQLEQEYREQILILRCLGYEDIVLKSELADSTLLQRIACYKLSIILNEAIRSTGYDGGISKKPSETTDK